MALAHHDLGGTGPPLLLLHANGFHSKAFVPMVQHLKEHFHCIALDLNGHGESPNLGADRTLAAQSAAVLDKIHQLGLNGCYCFAHSVGGTLALLLSLAEDPQARATFAALYCFEPVVSAVPLPAAPPGPAPPDSFVTMAMKRKDRWPSMEAARAALKGRPPFSTFHADAFDAYLEHGLRTVRPEGDGENPGGMTLVCSRETEASVYNSLRIPPCADWSRMPCPVAIGVGKGGGAFDVLAAAGRKLSQVLPVSRLHRFPSLGHMGPLEDPKGVALHVIQCFAEVAATGTLAPQPKL